MHVNNREVTISGLAANGTYENQAGKAPKIVYNQHIEDYLQVVYCTRLPTLMCSSSLNGQGFCGSKWMQGYADYIGDG